METFDHDYSKYQKDLNIWHCVDCGMKIHVDKLDIDDEGNLICPFCAGDVV